LTFLVIKNTIVNQKNSFDYICGHKTRKMTRIEVLNAIIEKKSVKNYLEIGVNRGKCLFNIKGPEKRFAVDPFFNFNLWKKIKAIAKNPENLKNDYFEVTSDVFFNENKQFLLENKMCVF